VFGAGAWLAACRLADDRHNVSLNKTAGLFWWAAVWQMLDWHLGMAEGGDGCRRRRLSPADAATLTRFWLVPLVFGARRTRVGFPSVIVLGGLSDVIDGSLARRHGRTRLGRDLDTTADLAFVGTAAVAASRVGKLPPFAAYAVGGRCLLGTAVALAVAFGRARRPAIRARTWGAAMRVGGLAVAAAGGKRSGAALLLVGCLVPPRSTAPQLSAA
jgi:phosphatidylglycerophosphate synthase